MYAAHIALDIIPCTPAYYLRTKKLTACCTNWVALLYNR